MALHPAVEEDAVRHRVVEIRIEMEGLVDATRGPDVVAEPQERRAFVAPRGRMLRPHPQDLVVAGDRSPVVPEFMEGRPLADHGSVGRGGVFGRAAFRSPPSLNPPDPW